MKKFKISKVDSIVWCKEINQLEKPELIDFSKGMHPTGAELSYNKEVKEWQEAQNNLDINEYELMLSWETEDGIQYIFHDIPKLEWEFFGEIVDNKVVVLNQ